MVYRLTPKRSGPGARSLCRILAAGLLLMSIWDGYAGKRISIRMATTTSTENSGLLSYLLPWFEKKSGIGVHVIAVGTGSALRYARHGDVDLVLVHSRSDEMAFVNAGFGVDRRDVMYNDFVIAGPGSDPAKVISAASATDALSKIAGAAAMFVSRGDSSGTHKMERTLWDECGISPGGVWYLETGQGMEAALMIASEKQAYTLSDRATFAAVSDRINLGLLFEGDRKLLNEYGVIAVNPSRHKHVHYPEAMRLIQWLTSQEGQDLITSYRIKGRQLFFPVAKKNP